MKKMVEFSRIWSDYPINVGRIARSSCLILVLILMIMVSGCGVSGGIVSEPNDASMTVVLVEADDNIQPEIENKEVETAPYSDTPKPDSEINKYVVTDTENVQVREWTIKELGEIIVAGNAVWEDWWLVRGRFSWDNMNFSVTTPHLMCNSVKLLPESGFESLGDVRSYLLQYYTEEWVDWQLSHEFSIFCEYDNTLFINPDGSSYGRSYTSFRDATHALVEQEGNHTVVRTTALYGPWGMAYYSSWEEIEWLFEYIDYYFFFVDGRIDSITVPDWYYPLFWNKN